MNTEQNKPLSGGSLATVWHEGSRSFYLAWLVRPMSEVEVAGELAASCGGPVLVENLPSILAEEVKKWKDRNLEIAELILRNDREEAVRWAKGLTLSEKDGVHAVTVDADRPKTPYEVGIQILKGTAHRSGDGFKDETKKGDVVFVWNQEKPEPYAKGQYPRLGYDNWTASTDMVDFVPATVDESIEALNACLKKLEASTKKEWLQRLGPLLKFRYFLSYNNSYFGEPAGLLKTIIASCCRALEHGLPVTVIDTTVATEKNIVTGVDARPPSTGNHEQSVHDYNDWAPVIPTEFPHSTVFVEVKFRGGGSHSGQVREFVWTHAGFSSDIVGFRIRPTPPGYQASGYPPPPADDPAACI